MRKAETELEGYKKVLAKLIREAMKDISPTMSDEDVISLYLSRP